jgi:transcriptional regulator with XRE-family HTH domain
LALKIPGCSQRISDLWASALAANPALSQRQFAKDHDLDPTKFNNWTKDTQPDLEGLEQLERVFGVPWQWLLVGDEGMAALEIYSRKRGPSPEARAPEPPGDRQPEGRAIPKVAKRR